MRAAITEESKRPTSRAVGVIDIGSSAIRLVIAEIEPGGGVTVLESLQRPVALGQDCFSRGRIETPTTNVAIEILRGFLWVCRPYEVRALRAVATSAVREASNRDLFVERVYMATGVSVEVIASAEEHRLVYVAVRDAFESEGLSPDRDSVIVELSSSSADLTRFRAGQVLYSGTFPFGTTRLLNAVRAASPGASSAPVVLKRHVVDAADTIERSCSLGELRSFIAVGAEARFAAERLAPAGDGGARVRPVPRREFLRLASAIAKLRPEEVARRHGLSFEDCEALAPALLTYAEILKRTPAARLLVPTVSMRDGLVRELAAEVTGQPLTYVEEQVVASARSLGRHFQYDEPHARRVAELACQLFDDLAAEHGLGQRERRMLQVAALLHDVGVFISPSSHHKHSEYIIEASDIFGLRPEEKGIVARVARYHRRALPQPAHASFASLPRRARATVTKLAALLRVADALDRSHAGKVRRLEVELTRDALLLHAEADEDLALEQVAVRSKGNLFEEAFGRKVVLDAGLAREDGR